MGAQVDGAEPYQPNRRSFRLVLDSLGERRTAREDRLDNSIPEQMSAVLLTGHGGFDRLEYREDVPVPRPGAGEVLIRVAAAGVNNTDINTRIGWYSKRAAVGSGVGGGQGLASVESVDAADASWAGAPLRFPRIQGADCCGHIVAVGEGVPGTRIGERVIVPPLLRSYRGFRPFQADTLGSELDGAFARYTKTPAGETCRVECDWSSVELASMPCAYSTAENMLHRAGLGAERVLVTGASGGVGSAAVQLAKRRGAQVIAQASASKASDVRALGADEVIHREASAVASIGRGQLDLVVDIVGGEGWAQLLDLLRAGGRYVCAGAIAGPTGTLDLRTLYLRDLTLIGCTIQDDGVFDNLVSYIERGEVRPVVAKTYPLADIVAAQTDFLTKQFTGKLTTVRF